MKKTLFVIFFAMLAVSGSAQSQIKYGSLSYQTLLREMPEYAEVQTAMKQLVQKYEVETRYNERKFQQMFTDFLQGQKDFPQPIMLKRQHDLQLELERGQNFRLQMDSLLQKAENDMLAPLHQTLDSLIHEVGMERGYEYIVDTDKSPLVFVHPSVTEDATPFVREKLAARKP